MRDDDGERENTLDQFAKWSLTPDQYFGRNRAQGRRYKE